MVDFYVRRLDQKRTKKERQRYLDSTVPRQLRDEVREQWNSQNPGSPLD